MSPTSIDLFAGCGGLSLGLERSGFRSVFVSELHPSALETYLINRPDDWIHERQNHIQDLLSLTQAEGELEALARRLRNEFGDIDLVAGGPPCQGFSGIGHRRTFTVEREKIPSNHLYREMAKFIQVVGPKSFVFENVRGLLNSRWTPDGEAGEIWEDVQSAFRAIRVRKGRRVLSYRIQHKLLFAKDFGVPQNRPRVILVGLREDLCNANSSSIDLLPVPDGVRAPDISELLSDLVDPNWQPGGSTLQYLIEPRSQIQSELRTHPGGQVLSKGAELLEQLYSKHSERTQSKFLYMLSNGGQVPIEYKTKKFAQRVLPAEWGASGPSVTVTSLPDDFVHYSQPRTPTVREWSRLQLFPDWYRFAGRRTTGGRRRAGDLSIEDWSRDLPKYTQIGNAVPVALGQAIGSHLRKLLS